MRSQNLDKILKHFLYNIFRFLSLKNSKLNIYQTSILINAENLKANSLIFLKKATTTATKKKAKENLQSSFCEEMKVVKIGLKAFKIKF